jgi:hypothetical protein
MIDPSLFTVESLLDALLDHEFGNCDRWRCNAEILPTYRAPFAKDSEPTRCVVHYPMPWRERGLFLRHSKWPRQGHFWDIYGDDYQTPDLALIAFLEAPVPPGLLRAEVWRRQ